MTVNNSDSHQVRLFSTCPMSSRETSASYFSRVTEVAKWSEDIGCKGILVYTDNSLVDPWLASQVILENTSTLCPLVAVQPVYMHPFAAAKMVATIAFMHGRRIYLNMLAGGFKNDLTALGDTTPHDDRYVRTTEYTQIIRKLLESDGPVSFEGKYYAVSKLRMRPSLDSSLFPGILISGSSPAGLQAARAIGATAVKYPKPPGEETPTTTNDSVDFGLRVGIIARQSQEEAWQVAHERFPDDRTGQLTHQLAMKMSDSHWHKQLSIPDTRAADESPYWLGPFKNYQTFCPYLVGTCERVADEIRAYLDLGFRTVILDIPPSREELRYVANVFELAGARRA